MLAQEFIETSAQRHRRLTSAASKALAQLRASKPVASVAAAPVVAPAAPAVLYDPPYDVMWFHDLITMPVRIDDQQIVSKRLVKRIQVITARHYKVRLVDMLSERRTPDVTLPRQVAMYLCCRITLRNQTDIAALFANRDRSTVWHAIKKISALRLTDKKLAADIDAIEREVMR